MSTQWDYYPKNILKEENIANSSEDVCAVREKVAGSLKAPVSVGQAIAVLNSLFKESPILYFCIIGELSKLTIHSSGHLYFEMRDQNNQGVKVAKVNTMNCEGKTKRRGMTFGKTAKTKKAIVTLTADSKDIEIFAGL